MKYGVLVWVLFGVIGKSIGRMWKGENHPLEEQVEVPTIKKYYDCLAKFIALGGIIST